jgi:solute carrier family 25 citrate transporter 1
MSTTQDKPVVPKKKTPIGVHLLAGGTAGMAEAFACRTLISLALPVSQKTKDEGPMLTGYNSY